VKLLSLCLTLCLACSSVTFAASGAVVREPGAIYLEDLVPKPIRVTVTSAAPIFYGADLGRYLGTLPAGQSVELQAVGDGAYRVRGKARQGQVAGWVDPRYVTPLKKEFLTSLRQNAERREAVQALIGRNEIAVNMTPEEVTASLGKPPRTTSRVDANGRQEVWEFVRYERVPQQVGGYDRFGRPATGVVYVKVPVGKLSVVFENNLVSALEQTEGTLERAARAKIVAAPFAIAH
jgi:hypothetical protein